MKKQLIGFLLVLISVQAMAVGHPHNLFAARKQLKAKELVSTPVLKSTGKTAWTMLHQVKTGVETGCRVITLLRQVAGN